MKTTNLLIKTLICLCLLMILMTSQTLGFMSSWFPFRTHQDITRDAVLQTTADVCKSQALQDGWNFVMPDTLTVESVAEACSSSDLAKDFQSSINEIIHHNAWVDFWHYLSAAYHFDNEEFLSGREIITEGVFAVKGSIKQQNYQAAREALGKVLHTLQDFYSHSNWIELGNTQPYSNLIKPDTPISNIADSETCSRCYGEICSGNLLEEIIVKQKLTSGYFDWSTPKGKCSHGGLLNWEEGGINKDTDTSGHLHYFAAMVATNASRELLQDIRAAVGDSEFLRLMGLSQASVLCFVIDTSISMSNGMDEIRRLTSSVVDSKTGTAAQISEYILVPFNDADFGPLMRTTDPNAFKQQLDALTPIGGGDSQTMSLSALQLALAGSPPQTEIFVFTNADAKDKWLTSTVRALIKTTKSVVNFMLTDDQQQASASPVYQDLAEASGGQVIEVTSGTLAQATGIIAVTSRSTLVTLFQALQNPAKAENFSVWVDSSVHNLTIYITGNRPDYTITSPTGVSQSSAELNGTLGFIQRVGNFDTVQPNIAEQTGVWHICINSTQPYTIRVVGQSKVDFLFDFVVKHPYSSYAVLNSKPATNTRITLLVTMTGGDNVSLTEVSLVEASSLNSLNEMLLEEVAIGQYLATFNRTPAGDFAVRVVGQISSSRSVESTFQRQSPTQFQTSSLTITTQPVGTMEPGTPFTLPFTVTTSGSGGIYHIRVSNDRDFVALFKSSTTLASGKSADGMVTLFAPENTSSGTDVTVTIQAEAIDGSDSNYAVLRLAVMVPVTDFTPPICEAVSVNGNCWGNCSLSSWYLTANVTDGNGSGVKAVRVLQGNGNLNTTTVLSDTGVDVTMVNYNSSCCSPVLELVAVDAVGNVATCLKSVIVPVESTITASLVTTNTTTTTITTNTTSTANPTIQPNTTMSIAHPTNQTNTTMSTAHPTKQTNTATSTVHPTSRASTNGVECCMFLFFLWFNVRISFYQFIQL